MRTGRYHRALWSWEKDFLSGVFKEFNGNQALMAEVLGLNRATLRKKLARAGLYEIRRYFTKEVKEAARTWEVLKRETA